MGFKKASVATAINRIFPPPELPSSFVPRHNLEGSSGKAPVKKSTNESQSDRHFLNSSDRAVLLGEKEPKKAVESVFELITEEDRTRIDNAKRNAENTDKFTKASAAKIPGEIEPEKPRRSSRWDSKVKQSIAHVASNVEGSGGKGVFKPFVEATGDAFNPFASNPEKQERYDAYLATKKLGKEPEISYKRY